MCQPHSLHSLLDCSAVGGIRDPDPILLVPGCQLVMDNWSCSIQQIKQAHGIFPPAAAAAAASLCGAWLVGGVVVGMVMWLGIGDPARFIWKLSKCVAFSLTLCWKGVWNSIIFTLMEGNRTNAIHEKYVVGDPIPSIVNKMQSVCIHREKILIEGLGGNLLICVWGSTLSGSVAKTSKQCR